jgi:uncharacterized protein (TIGR03435 family)
MVLVSVALAAQSIEFEVASVKRNTSNSFGSGPPILPNGEVRMINSPMRTLIAWAFPLEVNVPIVNLPSWAETERYDLVAKGKPDATVEERQQMFRALLTQRAKLAAHFEARDQASYDLVVARPDGRLGPGLTPSRLDCSARLSNAPAPPTGDPGDLQSQVMNRCNLVFTGFDDTSYAGGARMELLIRMVSVAAGRPVIDRTGLTGFYAVKLRFQRFPQRAAEPSPDAPPSVFTALPEQLGLKLEPSRTQVQALVIDHLERPDEN